MAEQIHVAGLVAVKVGTGSAGALETLGYTRNGADVRGEAFFEEIHGDQFGGDAGPPIDIQFMGEVAHVRLELNKYDSTIADKLLSRVLGTSAGTVATPGTLMFAGAKYVRVLLHAVTLPLNFPCCVLRAPYEINKGTRHSRLILEFTAYLLPGQSQVYNNTTT